MAWPGQVPVGHLSNYAFGGPKSSVCLSVSVRAEFITASSAGWAQAFG